MSGSSRAQTSGKKIVVGLTGRIDSAVTAFLLKKQGFQVIGLSIVTVNEDITSAKEFLPKCHVMDLDKVREFCAKIDIPFYATDAKSEYEDKVLDPLISNKLSGRANATCFNCTVMRMQVLYKKMKLLKADFIATGHFCKVHKNLISDEYFIHSNNDANSDQSFLLAGTSQEVLKHLVLPLGELRKSDVMKYAKSFNLKADPSSEQVGYCFKAKESTEKLLKKTIPKSMIHKGVVLHKATTDMYGDHEGITNHYITEPMTGMKLGGVVKKDLEVVGFEWGKNNLLIGNNSELTYKGAQIVNITLSATLDRKKPIVCFIKFKYENIFIKAKMHFKNNHSAVLEFEKDVYPLIKDESLVIYDSNNRNSKIIGNGHVGKRGLFQLVDRVTEFRVISDEDFEKGNIHFVKEFKF